MYALSKKSAVKRSPRETDGHEPALADPEQEESSLGLSASLPGANNQGNENASVGGTTAGLENAPRPPLLAPTRIDLVDRAAQAPSDQLAALQPAADQVDEHVSIQDTKTLENAPLPPLPITTKLVDHAKLSDQIDRASWKVRPAASLPAANKGNEDVSTGETTADLENAPRPSILASSKLVDQTKLSDQTARSSWNDHAAPSLPTSREGENVSVGETTADLENAPRPPTMASTELVNETQASLTDAFQHMLRTDGAVPNAQVITGRARKPPEGEEDQSSSTKAREEAEAITRRFWRRYTTTAICLLLVLVTGVVAVMMLFVSNGGGDSSSPRVEPLSSPTKTLVGGGPSPSAGPSTPVGIPSPSTAPPIRSPLTSSPTIPFETNPPLDTLVPTPSPRLRFTEKKHLVNAVDDYLDRIVSNETEQTPVFSIGSWDVSAIEDFSGLFDADRNGNAKYFNDPGVSFWNISRARSLNAMFRGASSFDQNLSSWNVSRCRLMTAMFLKAKLFNGTIGTWDTSSVRTMVNMFAHASSFDQDLSLWDVSSVANMHGMFAGATSFNSPITAWRTYRGSNMKIMFRSASAFNQDLLWDVSRVQTMESMFQNAVSFNKNISPPGIRPLWPM